MTCATRCQSRPRANGGGERLAACYIEDHLSGLSLRFREKQTYLRARWVLARIGARAGTAWTSRPQDRKIQLGGSPTSGGSAAAALRAGCTNGLGLAGHTVPAGGSDPVSR